MREPVPLSRQLHGRVVPGAFVPHPLLANPHLQTIATTLRPMPHQPLRI